MVFITAGMGGGTGTGAAPAIAKISRETNALTVGIVTKPFAFEGPIRKKRALEGIKEMKSNCDTLLVIPNETLLEIASDDTTVTQSFKLADSILNQATKGISDLINKPGLINLDYADVRTIMKNMGDAIMGTGIAKGEEKAILAAQQAINSPLLQNTSIKGAKGLLVNVSGSQKLSMRELNEASNIIYEEAGEDANVILGCVIDSELNDEIRITVIATGLNNNDYPDFYESEPEYDFKNKYILDTNKNIGSKDEDEVNNTTQQTLEEMGAKEKNKNENNVDFDVPTYLRNKGS